MIYTITLNPAIDLVMKVADLAAGELNRSEEEAYIAGGKGINASVVFQRLGQANTATGFLGGFTGSFIEHELQAQGIATAFIPVEGLTRINVKVKGQKETEINARGPEVSQDDFEELLAYLEERLLPSDWVFLAGNTAPGLGSREYALIADCVYQAGSSLILDSNGDLVKACLPYRPFIIKPNQEELSELAGFPVRTGDDVIWAVDELQEAGARNVLVSLGGAGSALFTEKGPFYRANAAEGQLVNSVGAGDSMLAGFMAEYIESGDFRAALKQGSAMGSATAFSLGIGEKQLMEKLKTDIEITDGIEEGELS